MTTRRDDPDPRARRRPLSPPARAALALALTGATTWACATEQPPPSELRVTSGAEGKIGDVSVSEVLLANRPSPGDVVYRPGESVDVHATIANAGDEADRLVSVSSPVAATATVDGDAALPAHHALATRYPGQPPRPPNPATAEIGVRLDGLRTPIRSGTNYPVVFTFARAGVLRLDVAVDTSDVPREDCPLPPNGKPPRTLIAPPGAPVPPAPPPPHCSSLP